MRKKGLKPNSTIPPSPSPNPSHEQNQAGAPTTNQNPDRGLLILQDPLNFKRYVVANTLDGSQVRGSAKDVGRAIGAFVDDVENRGGRSPPTNIEWAALRTLAGVRPVIVPTRKGGAWLYIERLSPRIYEIRVIAPTSSDRGRARLVTARELAIVITKVRAKKSSRHNHHPDP